jgi:hypothetical protein
METAAMSEMTNLPETNSDISFRIFFASPALTAIITTSASFAARLLSWVTATFED